MALKKPDGGYTQEANLLFETHFPGSKQRASTRAERLGDC